MIPLRANYCGSCGADQNVKDLKRFRSAPPVDAAGITRRSWLKGRTELLMEIPPLLAEVKEGRGKAVIFTGPRGCGKTSIISHVSSFGYQNNLNVFNVQCSQLTAQIALYPFLDVIKQIAGFLDDDDAEMRGTKIGQLSRRGLSAGEISIIANYFGIRPAPEYPNYYPPEGDENAFFYSFIRIISSISMQQPVMIIIDDAHYIDAQSCALLDSLTGVANRMRLMLVVGARTLPVKKSPEDEHVSVIKVDPLDELDLTIALEERLKVKTIQADLAKEIYLASAGNPEFAIQYIKYLIENRIALKERGLLWPNPDRAADFRPASFEAILKNRIDRLTNDQKTLLLAVEILSDDCGYETLKNLFPERNHALSSDIDALTSMELIIKKESHNGRVYKIKESGVAQYLESTTTESFRREFQPAIAKLMHEKGGFPSWRRDFTAACHYAWTPQTAAGSRAHLERLARVMAETKQYALSARLYQALSRVVHALVKNPALDDEERGIFEQKLAHILQDLGLVFKKGGDARQAQKAFELSYQVAKKINFKLLAIDCLAEITDCMRLRGNVFEAHKAAAVTIEAAKEAEDDVVLSRAQYILGQLFESQNLEDKAYDAYMEALETARKVKSRIGAEASYGQKALIALASIALKKGPSAVKQVSYLLIEALDRTFYCRDIYSLQILLDRFGRYFLAKKDVNSAIQYTDIALKVARARLDYREMAGLSYSIGYYYTLLGDKEKAEIYLVESLSIAMQCNWPKDVELSNRALDGLRKKVFPEISLPAASIAIYATNVACAFILLNSWMDELSALVKN